MSRTRSRTINERLLIATLAACAGAVLGPGGVARAPAADTPPVTPSDAGRMLADARSLLLSEYYDDKLRAPALDVAAVQGMMAMLNGGKAEGPNSLLDERATGHLRGDLKGELIGIGAQIDFNQESGLAQVLNVLPGSSAASAGLANGDRIVSIDGQEFRGRDQKDVISAIRGKEGTTVELSLLRGAAVLKKTITRKRIAFPSLQQVVYGDLGLITIRLFNERTPGELGTALRALQASHIKRLVIDLRDNAGGLFDKAVEAAELLVPRGAEIVRTVGRGEKLKRIHSQRDPILGKLPLVVVVDAQTASSAEVLAETLRVSAGATLVGARTFGKWRMEMLHPLPGGYTLKYTVALIQSPLGISYDGKGLVPDLEVAPGAQPLDQTRQVQELDRRTEVDPQLKAAVHVVRLRGEIKSWDAGKEANMAASRAASTAKVTERFYEGLATLRLDRWREVVHPEVEIDLGGGGGSLRGRGHLEAWARGFRASFAQELRLLGESLELDSQGDGRGTLTLHIAWRADSQAFGLPAMGHAGASVETMTLTVRARRVTRIAVGAADSAEVRARLRIVSAGGQLGVLAVVLPLPHA